MSESDRVSRVVNALAVNLNQAANVVLLTFVASKPVMLHRFGVTANAAAGLLVASVLKLRITPITTGTIADLGTDRLSKTTVTARGFGIFKTLTGGTVSDPASVLRINQGDTVTVTISTDAGATSTGDVFLEYWDLPFAGAEIDNMTASSV